MSSAVLGRDDLTMSGADADAGWADSSHGACRDHASSGRYDSGRSTKSVDSDNGAGRHTCGWQSGLPRQSCTIAGHQ